MLNTRGFDPTVEIKEISDEEILTYETAREFDRSKFPYDDTTLEGWDA